MANARQTVYELLIKTELEGAYSNIALDNALTESGLKQRDKLFAAALFYGVLERKMTLDLVIRVHSSIEYDKIEPKTVQLLRMGIYQLLYMDSVPDSAAVNETVKLCPQNAKGYVNAVLRAFQRNGKKIDLDALDELRRMSVEYSCPKWLVKMWCADFGKEKTEKILSSSFGRPPLYVRVNTVACSAEDLIYELSADKIKSHKHEKVPDCVVIDSVGESVGIESSRAYKNGLFHVQDISSQLCCRLLNPVMNETVLDMCAAPGGKSFTIAEMMGNKGKVLSFDLYEHRTALISEGAKRLGLDIITAGVNDAAIYNENIPQADKVLCDAPCSGLGVIRRKPEIKYKPKAELADLPQIQRRVLDTASRYVKVGGVLMYSTCTLCRSENEDVVNDFLREHTEFSPIVVPLGPNDTGAASCRTFLPDTVGGDGFFTATMKRIR